MRKFISTLFWLVMPVVVLCVTALGVEILVYRHAMCQPNCTIGIIGDSRVQCNVNPEFFPGLANFGQRTSQPMVWKAKLATILEVNPQINTFIVELSPACYMRMTDKSVAERAQFTRGHIPSTILLDLFNAKEMGGLPPSGLSRNFIRGIVAPFLSRCITFSKKSPLQEGYYPLNRKVQDSKWWKDGCKVVSGIFPIPKNPQTNVKAEVEEVITMLQSRKIKVVLITAPFSRCEGSGMFIDGEWEFFENEMIDLCARYGCKWYNYRTSMPCDEYWADSGHLNIEGAERFSAMLKRDYEVGMYKK